MSIRLIVRPSFAVRSGRSFPSPDAVGADRSGLRPRKRRAARRRPHEERREDGEPLGERIIVTGRVLDEAGRPVPNTLVEIWQANAAGRYIHHIDQHDAPLDPNSSAAAAASPTTNGRYRS